MLSPAKRACRNSIPFNLDNPIQLSKVWNMLGGVSLVTGRNLRDAQVKTCQENRATVIFSFMDTFSLFISMVLVLSWGVHAVCSGKSPFQAAQWFFVWLSDSSLFWSCFFTLLKVYAGSKFRWTMRLWKYWGSSFSRWVS